jgi:hypothetical protein
MVMLMVKSFVRSVGQETYGGAKVFRFSPRAYKAASERVFRAETTTPAGALPPAKERALAKILDF